MMSKHTSGPWSLVRSVKNWQMPLQIEAEDGTCIVALEPTPLHDMEANARLIASAPDLLEFITEWLSRQGNDVNYMTEKARAAIAKATGE